jgi:carbazole 1,9a-dioxygenase
MVANANDVSREVEKNRGKRFKPWQRYLDAELGLRNYWYPVLFSDEIGEGATQSATVCGERLYLKRIDGKVRCVEDRCPHRGVSFSARPECYTKDTLSCWFHGFTFDWNDGRLVQILTEADSPLVGTIGIKTYPTFEMNRTIFVWIGDDEPGDPRNDIQPRFFHENLVVVPLVRHKIKCNWRIASENGFDAAHLYGHRHAELFKHPDAPPIPLSTYPSDRKIVTIVEEEGKPRGVIKQDDTLVFAARVGDTDVRAARYPKDAPSVVNGLFDLVVGCYMPCGLEVDPFPVPGLVHFEWYVPIDEDHHMYTILQAGYATDDAQRTAFEEECHKVYGPLVWQEPGREPEGFNNFDAFGREQCHHAYAKEDWWNREFLFGPDYIITEWRKVVAKHARGIQTRGLWQSKGDD